jgi:hypothetical protein
MEISHRVEAKGTQRYSGVPGVFAEVGGGSPKAPLVPGSPAGVIRQTFTQRQDPSRVCSLSLADRLDA